MRRNRGSSSSGPRRPAAPCGPVVLAAAWLCFFGADPARTEEPLAARRAEIEKMDLLQKQQLLQRYERFANLSPEKQAQLRLLNEQIKRHPKSDELQRVVHRYYDWLNTLTSYQRAELLHLDPEKRIERIEAFKKEQARQEAARVGLPDDLGFERIKEQLLQESKDPRYQGVEHLSVEDVEGLLRWMDEVMGRRKSPFLENLPRDRKERVQRELANVRDTPGRRAFFALMWLRWQLQNPEKLPPGIETELAGLHAKLSSTTRQWLQSMPEDDQWRVIAGWIRFLFAIRSAFWRSGPPSSIMTEELADFFEQEVSEKERDQLLSYTPERMQWELWQKYLRWNMPELAFLFPDRPGGRGPPGGPWGGQFRSSRGGPSGPGRGRGPGRQGAGAGRFGGDRNGPGRGPDETRDGPPRRPDEIHSGPQNAAKDTKPERPPE